MADSEMNVNETIVLKKENYYGGLCNSFKIGDFISFLYPLINNINIKLNKKTSKIDLKNKIVFFKDNTQCKYKKSN